MKKIILYSVTLVLFLVSSCEDDLLDKKPLDKFSEIEVWTDAALAEGFIFDIYPNAVGLYATNYTDDWTDNIVGNNNINSLQAGTIDNNFNAGWNHFSSIRKCNLAIEKLMGNEDISESISKRLMAEARMMRAMIYFWQARRFGGLIIVDRVLTPNDELKLSRSSEEETYNFIITDIEEAIKGLPETAAIGRLDKAAAYAFLNMVALQAGNYDKVISSAEAIEAMEYELDEYSNMFNNYEATINSPEVILVFNRNEEHNQFVNTRMFYNCPNVSNGPKLDPNAIPQLNNSFECWPARWPSQEMVDAYLFNENGTAVQKKGVEFEGMYPSAMWKNRDDRFEVSIVRDSSLLRESLITLRRGGNMHWTSNPLSTWGMPKTGYIIRKWWYEDRFFFYNYPTDWAEPLLRLGEVYLNKAEAYYRKGNIPKAIEYTNMTRTFHGGLPEIPTGTSAAEFWELYKLERRVELFNEDDRYWSLIRWARADNATSIPELDGYRLHALDITDGRVKIVECPFFSSDMVFEFPKRLFFPVPDSEIKQNDNLNQNPDW